MQKRRLIKSFGSTQMIERLRLSRFIRRIRMKKISNDDQLLIEYCNNSISIINQETV